MTIAGFGRYRGSLVAHATGGNLLVINALGVEGYVKGVVPNEVPSLVAAPTRCARRRWSRAPTGSRPIASGAFDQYDDTRSQVYGGKRSETRRPTAPCPDTAKQVVTYHGELAITYYFSTSGGQTENSEFGFAGGNPVPYLKSVDDPYDDASPVHNWTETLSDDEMESKLGGLFEGQPAGDRDPADGQVAADRARPRRRQLRVDHGHRRHPARPPRPAVDLGEVHPPLSPPSL